MFKGRVSITEVLDMYHRDFVALLDYRSSELEKQSVRDAEAGDEVQEAMEGG